MHVRDSYLFRVTRDADLDLQEDEADDLLRAIESELRRRRFGEPVRIEIERGMPEYMRDFLCGSLELEAVDCYEIEGLMALSDLWQIVNLPGLRALARQAVHAGDSEAPHRRNRHFRADSRRRHPAAPSLRVVRSGHSVRATGGRRPERCSRSRRRSTVPRARTRRSCARCCTAAENEKQVAVVIELKARFDEENNIEWAKRLERAGAHVVYGFANQKVHAKTLARRARRRRRSAALHALRHGEL